MTNTKSLTELFLELGEKQVNVTYPDTDGNHVTSVRDLADRFSDKDWKTSFFYELLLNSKAVTPMEGVRNNLTPDFKELSKVSRIHSGRTWDRVTYSAFRLLREAFFTLGSKWSG